MSEATVSEAQRAQSPLSIDEVICADAIAGLAALPEGCCTMIGIYILCDNCLYDVYCPVETEAEAGQQQRSSRRWMHRQGKVSPYTRNALRSALWPRSEVL